MATIEDVSLQALMQNLLNQNGSGKGPGGLLALFGVVGDSNGLFQGTNGIVGNMAAATKETGVKAPEIGMKDAMVSLSDNGELLAALQTTAKTTDEHPAPVSGAKPQGDGVALLT